MGVPWGSGGCKSIPIRVRVYHSAVCHITLHYVTYVCVTHLRSISLISLITLRKILLKLLLCRFLTKGVMRRMKKMKRVLQHPMHLRQHPSICCSTLCICHAPEEHQLDLLDHVENPVESPVENPVAVSLPDKGCYEKDEEDDDNYYGGQQGPSQYQSGLGYIAVWHIVLQCAVSYNIITMSCTYVHTPTQMAGSLDSSACA